MVAEGEKQSAILRAEGEKQSAILRAEGEREAQFLTAQGRAAALDALYREARDVDEKTMTLQYLDALRALGASPATKYVIPLELVAMLQRAMSSISAAGSGSGEQTSNS
jgi:regulator of protease activity HflC (stomatin/prohibitin superfamily)